MMLIFLYVSMYRVMTVLSLALMYIINQSINNFVYFPYWPPPPPPSLSPAQNGI